MRDEEKAPRLPRLVSTLAAHDKRTYLFSLLRILSQQFTDTCTTYEDNWWAADTPQVSGAGALLVMICKDDVFKSLLVDWVTASNGGGIGEPIGIRRAALLVITRDPFTLQEVFDKSLHQFADKLWIRHTPVIRQEGWFYCPSRCSQCLFASIILCITAIYISFLQLLNSSCVCFSF